VTKHLKHKYFYSLAEFISKFRHIETQPLMHVLTMYVTHVCLNIVIKSLCCREK